MKAKLVISVIFCCIIFNFGYCQNDTNGGKKKYVRGFEFNTGIYITLDDFRNNSPIPSAKVISDYDDTETDFYGKVMMQKKVMYIDNTGKTISISSHDVWGYSTGLNIYINPKELETIQEGFTKAVLKKYEPTRLLIIGSICVFYYIKKTNLSIRYAKSYRGLKLMMDFTTGKCYKVNSFSLEPYFQKETDLYYLSKKYKGNKKAKLLFFINKYNEKYPIFFPKSDNQ